jgi:hypothetical protein
VNPEPNPYAPPIAVNPAPAPAEIDNGAEPRGIGGWLLLSLLGVVLVGGIAAFGLVRILMHWEQWYAALLHPPFRWGVAVRLILPPVIFTISVVAVVWMVRHDRRLPYLMVAFYCMQALVLLWALVSLNDIRSPSPNSAHEFGRQIGQLIPFIRCLVWVIYFMHSERVKNTFVK